MALYLQLPLSSFSTVLALQKCSYDLLRLCGAKPVLSCFDSALVAFDCVPYAFLEKNCVILEIEPEKLAPFAYCSIGKLSYPLFNHHTQEDALALAHKFEMHHQQSSSKATKHQSTSVSKDVDSKDLQEDSSKVKLKTKTSKTTKATNSANKQAIEAKQQDTSKLLQQAMNSELSRQLWSISKDVELFAIQGEVALHEQACRFIFNSVESLEQALTHCQKHNKVNQTYCSLYTIAESFCVISKLEAQSFSLSQVNPQQLARLVPKIEADHALFNLEQNNAYVLAPQGESYQALQVSQDFLLSESDKLKLKSLWQGELLTKLSLQVLKYQPKEVSSQVHCLAKEQELNEQVNKVNISTVANIEGTVKASHNLDDVDYNKEKEDVLSFVATQVDKKQALSQISSFNQVKDHLHSQYLSSRYYKKPNKYTKLLASLKGEQLEEKEEQTVQAFCQYQKDPQELDFFCFRPELVKLWQAQAKLCVGAEDSCSQQEQATSAQEREEIRQKEQSLNLQDLVKTDVTKHELLGDDQVSQDLVSQELASREQDVQKSEVQAKTEINLDFKQTDVENHEQYKVAYHFALHDTVLQFSKQSQTEQQKLAQCRLITDSYHALLLAATSSFLLMPKQESDFCAIKTKINSFVQLKQEERTKAEEKLALNQALAQNSSGQEFAKEEQLSTGDAVTDNSVAELTDASECVSELTSVLSIVKDILHYFVKLYNLESLDLNHELAIVQRFLLQKQQIALGQDCEEVSKLTNEPKQEENFSSKELEFAQSSAKSHDVQTSNSQDAKLDYTKLSCLQQYLVLAAELLQEDKANELLYFLDYFTLQAQWQNLKADLSLLPQFSNCDLSELFKLKQHELVKQSKEEILAQDLTITKLAKKLFADHADHAESMIYHAQHAVKQGAMHSSLTTEEIILACPQWLGHMHNITHNDTPNYNQDNVQNNNSSINNESITKQDAIKHETMSIQTHIQDEFALSFMQYFDLMLKYKLQTRAMIDGAEFLKLEQAYAKVEQNSNELQQNLTNMQSRSELESDSTEQMQVQASGQDLQAEFKGESSSNSVDKADLAELISKYQQQQAKREQESQDLLNLWQVLLSTTAYAQARAIDFSAYLKQGLSFSEILCLDLSLKLIMRFKLYLQAQGIETAPCSLMEQSKQDRQVQLLIELLSEVCLILLAPSEHKLLSITEVKAKNVSLTLNYMELIDLLQLFEAKPQSERVVYLLLHGQAQYSKFTRLMAILYLSFYYGEQAMCEQLWPKLMQGLSVQQVSFLRSFIYNHLYGLSFNTSEDFALRPATQNCTQAKHNSLAQEAETLLNSSQAEQELSQTVSVNNNIALAHSEDTKDASLNEAVEPNESNEQNMLSPLKLARSLKEEDSFKSLKDPKAFESNEVEKDINDDKQQKQYQSPTFAKSNDILILLSLVKSKKKLATKDTKSQAKQESKEQEQAQDERKKSELKDLATQAEAHIKHQLSSDIDEVKQNAVQNVVQKLEPNLVQESHKATQEVKHINQTEVNEANESNNTHESNDVSEFYSVKEYNKVSQTNEDLQEQATNLESMPLLSSLF